MVGLSLNLCVKRKNKGSMTRRRARMPTLRDISPCGIVAYLLYGIISCVCFERASSKTSSGVTALRSVCVYVLQN